MSRSDVPGVNKYELIITKLDIIHRKKHYYSNSKILLFFSHVLLYKYNNSNYYRFRHKEDETMKYVCDVCGWNYDEEKGYQKEESLQEQNGKMFQKILNVHYVL